MRLIDADKLDLYTALRPYCSSDVCCEVDDIIDNAPTVNPYEWISVEDRLPEANTNCVVHYRHTYSENDGYYADAVCFFDGSRFNLFDKVYKVTHWMYLPTPPTEKEN